jgi:NADPH:quinone reductase-like Zn-dependent oxidoreductase
VTEGETMGAMAITEFGGPEKIQAMDLPKPVYAPDSVLIKTAAAGVNPVDWKIREGRQMSRYPHHFPLILGWDVAGIVEEVGDAVTRIFPGDRVCAYARKSCVEWGTYAEWVSVAEEAVAPAPEAADLVSAAALPLAGLTAWQALQALDVESGHKVLVHGGSGGVGTFMLQLLRERGAEALATSGPAGHEHIRLLGAAPIDRHSDVADQVRAIAPEGVDRIADLAGPHAVEATLPVLKDGGKVVSILRPPPLSSEDEERGVRAGYIFVRPYGDQLRELVAKVDAGTLIVHVDRTFPLEEAAAAHRALQAGGLRGKIALVVD